MPAWRQQFYSEVSDELRWNRRLVRLALFSRHSTGDRNCKPLAPQYILQAELGRDTPTEIKTFAKFSRTS